MMKYWLFIFPGVIGCLAMGCNNSSKPVRHDAQVIGIGKMPNAATDDTGNAHIVFGSGDSILYALYNKQDESFSKPVLVASLPHLVASHMRGPQIASTSHGLTIIACNTAGDIFSFQKASPGSWMPTARVNDVDTIAKEGFTALSGDGEHLFAVWLDLRDGHNKIFGAGSTDGGRSWSKNLVVYQSPDTTVCECCKPSVVIKGNDIYVMFRNWLNGNRDMYLAHSKDGGLRFSAAEKLGTGSWALNGCPMDGGGLTVQDNQVQTVWNRKGKIYTSIPGAEEKAIGEGRACTMTTVNRQNVYAWIEKDSLQCLLPRGRKIAVGKGTTPVLKPMGNKQLMYLWEDEDQVHSKIIHL
ncbi:MAG TPA: hypothetical protein VFV68_05970 [Agriterribacter sp.]|nr:hypothetical protein [Agriterribacter sp.]